MTDAAIIEKVRRMLALANHPNTNEHEAALAAERASELMLKHNLESFRFEDAKLETVERETVMITNEMWQKQLWAAVARSNFCYPITWNRVDMILVGRRENVEFVKELGSWLVSQVEAISIRESLHYYGPTNRRKWVNSFRLGMVGRINQRLKEWRAAQEAAEVKTRALVIRVDDENRDYVRREFPDLRNVHFKPSIAREAYAAGHKAGDTVGFAPSSRQVGENG